LAKIDESHAWSPPWTWNAQIESTHTTTPLTQSPVELSDRSGANHLGVEYNLIDSSG
jgi:hypothetical protein